MRKHRLTIEPNESSVESLNATPARRFAQGLARAQACRHTAAPT